MNFRPKMQSVTEGFTVLTSLKFRTWSNVVADLWHVRSDDGASGHYVSPDPRVVIFLGDGRSNVSLSTDMDEPLPKPSGRVSYIPAGVPIISQVQGRQDFQHLDLHFPVSYITQRFGQALDLNRIRQPILMQDNPVILQLAEMLAKDCDQPTHHDSFGDGLILAVLSEVFGLKVQPQSPQRGGLSPRKLREVKEYIAAHAESRIPISVLADKAQLSESWFAHAFKQSTGMPPARWQICVRVERACNLLCQSNSSLAEIAEKTGFADQAHLTRSFRSVIGLTPAAWRRENAPSLN